MTKSRKTSAFLRSCIFEALMLLLDQKKYEDITISELAEKAGVSRMTYYRTYENKEDVVVQFLKSQTDILLEQYEKDMNDRFKWYEDIFKLILDHQEVIYKILKTPQLCAVALEHFNGFAKVILPRIHEQAGHDTSMDLIVYETGGFLFLMSNWVLKGCEKTPKEMAELMTSYIRRK